MDAGKASINPRTFPAKLWRLVNDPSNGAVCWDSSGELVVLDQQILQKHLLSTQKNASECVDNFKTRKFVSFIRQMNLYGFKKVFRFGKAETHYYCNQNFKRNHPELLVSMMRLTVSNKAKLEAGLEVNCRPPNRSHRVLASGKSTVKDTIYKQVGSPFLSEAHQASPLPYHPSRPQSITQYNRSPVPQRSWTAGHGNTMFSLLHHGPGDVSGPTTMLLQQGMQGLANPGQKLNRFNPHSAQLLPGFYSSGCERYLPSSVATDMAGSVNQTAPYAHIGLYQPSCPPSFLFPGSHNQNSGHCEKEEMRSGLNLDTVFQSMGDLQPPGILCLVKVEDEAKEEAVPSPQKVNKDPLLKVSGAEGKERLLLQTPGDAYPKDLQISWDEES